MAVYLVSYDLKKPGKDYQPLWTRLSEWKAIRILESVWIINWNTTAVQLRDDLRAKIDQNDCLAVLRLSNEGAWVNLQGNNGQTLKEWLEAK